MTLFALYQKETLSVFHGIFESRELAQASINRYAGDYDENTTWYIEIITINTFIR